MAVSYGATFPVMVLLLSIAFTGYLEVNSDQFLALIPMPPSITLKDLQAVINLALKFTFTIYTYMHVCLVTINWSRSRVWCWVFTLLCSHGFQKWHSKIPPSVQWMSGLSRGVSTKAALRLFVVTLCVLITLLMAILNYVRCFAFSTFMVCDVASSVPQCSTHHLFPLKGFPTRE